MKIKTMKKQESDFVKNSSLIVNTKTVEKQRTTIDLTPEEHKFLKEQKVPLEEIRLLEILKKEEEWKLLSKKEKQNKRKVAISFLERESHNTIRKALREYMKKHEK